ncbi:hypothetical protein Tco_0999154 [Tanacetum coccineum]
MEQYLALSRENQAPGMVKPKIGGNVNFEIKSQFMRELREDTFFENKNEDAHDYVDQVLNIVSLFNIPEVSQDAVLLRVFSFTLTGSAKRWVDRLTPRAVNTWDLLKKSFILRYYPPSKTTKRLEDIHNFKQESDESLYQAWEWYNDLLYKCLTHDINIYQKWHDGTSSRNISSNSNTDGLAAIDLTLANNVLSMRKKNQWKRSSMVAQNNRERMTEVLQCKLPPKEQNLRNFKLPYIIGDFNFYVMADLGASVNVMPRGIFEFLKLTNLRKTNMLIEVANTMKKAPLGVAENILVGIDKFLFSSNFVIINRTPNETIILGRPFLATIHAKIHLFNREISLVVIDCFEEALDPYKDPMERRFDDYKWVFDL